MSILYKTRPPKDDEDLARDIRDAADAYNKAVRAATKAGLTVSTDARYQTSGQLHTTIGNGMLEVYVTRLTVEKL